MKLILVLLALTSICLAQQNPFLSNQSIMLFWNLSILIFFKVQQEPSECGVCCSTLSERPSMNFTFYLNTGHFVGGSGQWAVDTYGYSGNSKQRCQS